MLRREKSNKLFSLFITEIFVMYIIGGVLLIRIPASNLLSDITIINTIGIVSFLLGIVQTIGYVLFWSICHKAYKGYKYAFVHAKLIRHIKRALHDSVGFAIEEYAGEEKVVLIPKVRVTLSNDLSGGVVYIRNHMRYNTKLDTVNISSALGKYIVENQYISDNENYYVFEFEDSDIDRQLKFSSYTEFINYSKRYGDYTLFMDSKHHVTLSSLLLVGATGSGKTYALYSLILQLISNCNTKPIVYFADPKNSSLCVLGNKITPENTAGNIEDIISNLERFYLGMNERKQELKERLNEKLDADYRHWTLQSNIFVIDEFSSVIGIVKTMDKAKRDKFDMLLRNIVLQGRQLGFFLWVVMQKSDSSDIPTAIRDNLIWKIVLGQATNATYLTTFEESASLPKRKFGLGQGLFSYQGITRQPQITSFPTLNFDILEAVTNVNGAGVM